MISTAFMQLFWVSFADVLIEFFINFWVDSATLKLNVFAELSLQSDF